MESNLARFVIVVVYLFVLNKVYPALRKPIYEDSYKRYQFGIVEIPVLSTSSSKIQLLLSGSFTRDSYWSHRKCVESESCSLQFLDIIHVFYSFIYLLLLLFSYYVQRTKYYFSNRH